MEILKETPGMTSLHMRALSHLILNLPKEVRIYVAV